ncbi:PAS domain S-box protein [Caulobacter sp. SL161]|uniref:PAS domain S-box protein n=1 Tax=Caulobacter sp. SL161 TaxID=2995156 RepID=UPI0022732D2E|nr:PAS domain S-box protein [Caulobacter sp. SL161]MCY1646697.1 PAS domain S-box protein [Caulobacter sp. SL161]
MQTPFPQNVDALKASEAFFRLLTEHAGDVISRHRFAGTDHYVSPVVERMLGWTPEEIIREGFKAFYHPDDTSVVYEVYQRMRAGDSECSVRYRGRTKDGRYVWLESHLSLVRDESGAPSELVAVTRNIDERIRLEEEARQARDAAREIQQRAMLAEQVAQVAFWRVDLVTNEVYLSPRLRQIYGWSQDAPVSLGDVMRRFHPDDRAASRARVAERLRTGEPSRNRMDRIIRLDGELRHIVGSFEFDCDEDGRPVVMLGTTVDVTDLVAAQQSLAKTESRFQDLAKATRDIIIEVDQRGNILFVSAAVETVLGYTEDELLGRKAASLIHPDDLPRLVQNVGEVMADPEGCPPTLEARLLHKDGHWVWLQGRPVLNRAAGRIEGVLRDISEYKRARDELAAEQERAEKALEARSAFLANMSHELRTPLTAVIGFAALVEGLDNLPGEARDYVGRISTAGKALLSVINDVLEMSKLESGQVQAHLAPCALEPLIDDTVKMFGLHAAEKNLDISVSMIEPPPRVLMIDPDRVRQVLINLIGNAIRYTDVGSVTIEVIWRAELSELFISVKDTGVGIDPAHQAHLFKRFSQVESARARSRGGSGLGLVISKGLVEVMGGRIGASSRPGQGSSFWFVIPASAPLREALPGLEAEPVFEPVRAGGRILLADDNTLNREMTRAILGVFDAEVVEARDGQEAVEVAQSQAFDLILMDIRMPVLDGVDATRAIRAKPGPNQGAPILAFSADMDFQVTDIFDGLVRKPITAAQLIQAVAGVTRQANA